MGFYKQEILETRLFLKELFNQLYKFRKQNKELFFKLLDVAAGKITDHNKKIVLNKVQAREVFCKLYDLFDSGNDFKKVTIKVEDYEKFRDMMSSVTFQI